MSETEDDHYGNDIMLLIMIFMMSPMLVLMLSEREGSFPETFKN